MAAYLLMNLGAFAVVVAVASGLADSIEGYSHDAPVPALRVGADGLNLSRVCFDFRLPRQAVHLGGAITTGLGHTELIVLATIGVVNSVISAYYLNVVRLMFFSSAITSWTSACSR